MSGFCPDDWHGTTEMDLQDKSFGEDWHYWDDVRSSLGALGNTSVARSRAEQKRQYTIHDAAIAQAKCEGLTFHLLPLAEQAAMMDVAEAAILKAQEPRS